MNEGSSDSENESLFDDRIFNVTDTSSDEKSIEIPGKTSHAPSRWRQINSIIENVSTKVKEIKDYSLVHDVAGLENITPYELMLSKSVS